MWISVSFQQVIKNTHKSIIRHKTSCIGKKYKLITHISNQSNGFYVKEVAVRQEFLSKFGSVKMIPFFAEELT